MTLPVARAGGLMRMRQAASDIFLQTQFLKDTEEHLLVEFSA
jgi:hypothetical protein